MSDSGSAEPLREKAPAGLHDFCEELIDKYVERSAQILDIAAGTGALARRLRKKGYARVAANDLDATAFAAPEVSFTRVDLNTAFSQDLGRQRWDAILAVEIIEHLDNPLAFLRECGNMLKEGGYLLVTTPNILGSESLLQWLRRGHFLYFSPAWYRSLRHVSLLPAWLLDAKAVESGVDVVYRGFTPRVRPRDSAGKLHAGLRCAALTCLDLALRAFGRSKAEATGANYIILCRRQRGH